MLGDFNGTINFDPGNGTANQHSANGLSDVFLLKLNAIGQFEWVRFIAGENTQHGADLKIDNNNDVIVCGEFRYSIDFDPINPSDSEIHTSNQDGFIAKFSKDGDFQYTKFYSGLTGMVSMALDEVDNIHLVGNFSNSIDLFYGAEHGMITSNGGSDVFVLKANRFGDLIWLKSFGGSNSEYVYSVSLNSAGSVFTAGSFSHSVDFNPSVNDSEILDGGYQSGFIQVMNNTGNFIDVTKIGNIQREVAFDLNEDLYSVGNFFSDINEVTLTGNVYLISNGGYDVLMCKFSQEETLNINNATNPSKSIVLYPNPSNGVVNCDLTGLSDITIKVYNMAGDLVLMTASLNNEVYQINLNTKPGLYIVEIISNSNRQIKKLVIN